MPEKFANKYRIPSTRLKNWDYSNDSTYFITICAKERECLFGTVSNGIMNYSAIGQIILEELKKSFDIRAELFCDAFVIMPNHLHAILRIDHVETHGRASATSSTMHDRIIQTPGGIVRAHDHILETHGRASLPNTGIAFRPSKSISSFVAGFKSSATKRVNQHRQMPGMILWQERFHDHIIRNDAEYQRILEYTETNPAHWESDIHHNS